MAARRFIPPALLVLALCGGGAYTMWHYQKPYEVATAPVTTGHAVEVVYATAVVEPENWAAIAPIRTGRITEINVDEGDAVKAGDILARLDDTDLRAQRDEAQALLDLQTTEFSRAEELIKKGDISQQTYDQRKSSMEQTQARLRMIEEQIRQLALIAPIDGEILWRDVERGEVKEAGHEIFWVGQPQPLRLEAEVDEEDIPKIEKDQTVLISADAFPEDVQKGTVARISPKGDPVNKSYRVYMDLPADTKLMIGMTVETNTIVQEKDDALLVPTEALTGGDTLWLAAKNGNGHTAQKTAVMTGISGTEKTEITAGIKDGDTVILPPFEKIRDGMNVRTR